MQICCGCPGCLRYGDRPHGRLPGAVRDPLGIEIGQSSPPLRERSMDRYIDRDGGDKITKWVS